MHRQCTFITGSKYEGTYLPSMQKMEGFGRYTYPDGSEYLGFFKNGLFHGFGRLQLPRPYNFSYKGHFSRGRLIAIEEMSFADGLKFNAYMKGKHLDSSQWKYCCATDRRYASELYWGLESAGPSALETKWRQPRRMDTHYYDLEEGLYSEKTGFISLRPRPFRPLRFVGCPKEREWIVQHCRREAPRTVIEPDPHIGHRIIQTNLRFHKSRKTQSESARDNTARVCHGSETSSLELFQLRDPTDHTKKFADRDFTTVYVGHADCDVISIEPTASSDRADTPSFHSTTSFEQPSLALSVDELMGDENRASRLLKSLRMDTRTSIMQSYRQSVDRRSEFAGDRDMSRMEAIMKRIQQRTQRHMENPFDD